jgi:hypothetical protein
MSAIDCVIQYKIPEEAGGPCRQLRLVCCLVYSLNFETEAICSSETSCSPRTTWRYNLEDSTLHINRSVNLISNFS